MRLSSLLLVIAIPPVAGSTIPCFQIMFLQLGIPLEAISIILARNFIFFPCNPVTQYLCVESIMLESADKPGMLDRKQLEKES